MPAVCPATLEALTTNKSFVARLADLGGQFGSGTAIWPERLTVLSALYSDFPVGTYVLPKGCDHRGSLLTPKDYTTDVNGGGGENRERTDVL